MSDIYAILEKQTNQFVRFNGKLCWGSMSALQSSFHAGQKYWAKENQVKWKEQDCWKAVNLTEAYYRLEGLMK